MGIKEIMFACAYACIRKRRMIYVRNKEYVSKRERDKERESIGSDLFIIELFTSDVFQRAIRMATAVFSKEAYDTTTVEMRWKP